MIFENDAQFGLRNKASKGRKMLEFQYLNFPIGKREENKLITKNK
jgi:hypothetical protein